ncbi:MAG: 50S ribosomal protein L25 [Bacteroidales bacterium]|nr:50S ribosomal protein L25 [Bacteroidales bacterium]
MKSFNIKVTARKDLGKKESRKLRLNDQVPCVLYGGKENVYFSAHTNTFKDIVYTHDVFLINIDVEGKTHQAVLKEIQFHPVTDEIMHIDFMETAPDKITIVELPVNLVGSSVGVREGGKLRHRKRYLRIKGLISDMPDSVEIDISELNVGQSVLASDLSYDKLEILEPKRAAIVSVISSRLAAKGMGEEPAVAEAAAEAEGGETQPGETPETAPAEDQQKK